jgi:hypothetical protein
MATKSEKQLAAAKRLIQKYEKKLETLKGVVAKARIEDALKLARDYAEKLQNASYKPPVFDDEPILEAPPPLSYVFATFPSNSTPPIEGYLIPAAEEKQSNGNLISVRHQVNFEDNDEIHVPAIKLHITGTYKGTFIDTGISFVVGYVPFNTLRKCTVITASHKPWINDIWKVAWQDEFGTNMYVIKTGDSGKPVFSKLEGLDHSQLTVSCDEIEPDKKLIADPFPKKYLTMMLLWDFWKRHTELKNVNRNADLIALKLVETKSDHRSFKKDCVRSGIYFPKHTGGIAPPD